MISGPEGDDRHPDEPLLPNPFAIIQKAGILEHLSYGDQLKVAFDFLDDGKLGNAIVSVEPAQQDNPRRRAHVSIGHYDPARQEWLFWPELIPQDQQTGLKLAYQEEAEKARKSTVLRFNLYDKATQGMRGVTARLLRLAVSPQELLDRAQAMDNGEASLRHELPFTPDRFVDDATLYYLTLGLPPGERSEGVGLGASSFGDGFDYVLNAVFEGVIEYDGPQHCGRGGRIILPLAGIDRGELATETWHPNVPLILPDEWRGLRAAPLALMEWQRQHPGFRPEFCATRIEPIVSS